MTGKEVSDKIREMKNDMSMTLEQLIALYALMDLQGIRLLGNGYEAFAGLNRSGSREDTLNFLTKQIEIHTQKI